MPDDAQRLRALVTALTHHTRPALDPGGLAEVKALLRASAANVPVLWQGVQPRLRTRHAQVRLLALQLTHELFVRCRAFRDAVVGSLPELIDLTIAPGTVPEAPRFRSLLAKLRGRNKAGGSPNTVVEGAGEPLPPPEAVAHALRRQGLQCLQLWAAQFGPHYPRLSLAHSWLRESHHLTPPAPAAAVPPPPPASAEAQAEARRRFAAACAALRAALDRLEGLFGRAVPDVAAADAPCHPNPAAQEDEEETWERVETNSACAEVCSGGLPTGFQLSICIPATLVAEADPVLADLTEAVASVSQGLWPTVTAAWKQLDNMTGCSAAEEKAEYSALDQRWALCRRKCHDLGLPDPAFATAVPAVVGSATDRATATAAVPGPAPTERAPKKRLRSPARPPRPKKPRAAPPAPAGPDAVPSSEPDGSRRFATERLQRALRGACGAEPVERLADLATRLEAELHEQCKGRDQYREQLRRLLFNMAAVATRLLSGELAVRDAVRAVPADLAPEALRAQRRLAQRRAMEAAAAACMPKSQERCKHCGNPYVESVVIQQGAGKGHPALLLRCGFCNLAQ